jgi:GH25 family lysozyme M1 (1,4-beta-N-acetylmuramidase)
MGKKALYEGPDISVHQGAVDIKRIRDAGYKRIGIRAGYGKNNIDQKYAANALACYNLGVNVLLYWFSYAYTMAMAVAEAGYAIAQAKKYWAKCPIAFDLEYDSINYARKNGVAITKLLATDMAIAFLRQVKDAGYIPVIYTNRDYLRNYFNMERIVEALGTVYVWYARYTSSLPASEADIPDVWQYTSTGRIPGVNGSVDMNRFYTDFSESTVPAKREEKPNLNIKAFQAAANTDGYRDVDGNPLVEDGIDGTKTQYVRRKIALQARKSGRKYVAGSTGAVVGWWQQRCNEILGHGQVVDRKYGPAARTETMAVQRKLGLKVDGIAGYNSIQSAFYN